MELVNLVCGNVELNVDAGGDGAASVGDCVDELHYLARGQVTTDGIKYADSGNASQDGEFGTGDGGQVEGSQLESGHGVAEDVDSLVGLGPRGVLFEGEASTCGEVIIDGYVPSVPGTLTDGAKNPATSRVCVPNQETPYWVNV